MNELVKRRKQDLTTYTTLTYQDFLNLDVFKVCVTIFRVLSEPRLNRFSVSLNCKQLTVSLAVWL